MFSEAENGRVQRQHSLPTQLTYDVTHAGYTRGIDVQQANISSKLTLFQTTFPALILPHLLKPDLYEMCPIFIPVAGDLSIWEFSGYEPYYMTYDHFIGDPNCIHMILFSMEDSQDVQLAQVLFWLNFIKARISPMEPIGEQDRIRVLTRCYVPTVGTCYQLKPSAISLQCNLQPLNVASWTAGSGGRQPWPAKVCLVGTHADKVNCAKDENGEFVSEDADVLLATVLQKFQADVDITQHVFVMDAHLAMATDMKALRIHLGILKSEVVQVCTN